MDFILQYNSIVNKNKNLFYFNNYCNDMQEFMDWLSYNDVSISEFEELNEELKNVYLTRKGEYIMSGFRTIKAAMLSLLGTNDDNLENHMENIIEFLSFYNKNQYYIDILGNKSNRFKRVKEYFNNNKQVMLDIIDEYLVLIQ